MGAQNSSGNGQILKNAWRAIVPLSVRKKSGARKRWTNLVRPEFERSKTIFVHIPKSAGSSIGIALYGHDRPGHFPAQDYVECLGIRRSDFLIFTFVRNPISRFAATYYYLAAGGKNPSDTEFRDEVLAQYADINDFAERYMNEVTLFSHIYFFPQTHFLLMDGILAVDFVGRYETLDQDFDDLCRIFGMDASLEKVNVTPSVTRDELIPANEQKLRSLYAKDFEVLGYE